VCAEGMPTITHATPFLGFWEDAKGATFNVKGTQAADADGKTLDFSIVSRKKCALKVGSTILQGSLAADGNTITWSDGSAWDRRVEALATTPVVPTGPAAEELGAWLRSVDAKKLSQYWPKLCELVNGIDELRLRYGGRAQDFLADMGVEHPVHKSAFARAIRALGEAERPSAVDAVATTAAVEPAEAELEQDTLSQAGELTLDQVLRLQRELYVAFSDNDFQGRLAAVEAEHGRALQNYCSQHTELFLTVQDRILPRYGFPEGQKGVLEMLKASARFNSNRQFQRNRTLLNQLLGLAQQRGEREAHLAEIAAQGDNLPSVPAVAETLQVRYSGLPLPSRSSQGAPSAS